MGKRTRTDSGFPLESKGRELLLATITEQLPGRGKLTLTAPLVTRPASENEEQYTPLVEDAAARLGARHRNRSAGAVRGDLPRKRRPAMRVETCHGGIRIGVETSALAALARFVVRLGDAARPETPALAQAVAELARGALAQAEAALREGALRHRAPTKDKSQCVADAVWLGFEALPLFPSFSKAGRGDRLDRA